MDTIENTLKDGCLRIKYEHHLLKDMFEARETREPIELVVTTCPPYSTSDDGTFLFDGTMQQDAGIVARHVIEQLKDLFVSCQQNSVPVKLTFAYADHEGKDIEILQTLHDQYRLDFEQYIQYAMNHVVYLANTFFHQNGLTLVQVDVCKMSERIFADEDYKTQNYEIGATQFSEISRQRSSVHSRMYGSPSRDLKLRRTKIDIQEHIALGLALQRERAQGRKVSIVTMSIPHLAKLFNEIDICKIPVIRLTQNY